MIKWKHENNYIKNIKCRTFTVCKGSPQTGGQIFNPTISCASSLQGTSSLKMNENRVLKLHNMLQKINLSSLFQQSVYIGDAM